MLDLINNHQLYAIVFLIWQFLGLGEKSVKKKRVQLLGDLKTPKFHSENNWENLKFINNQVQVEYRSDHTSLLKNISPLRQ